MIMDKVLILTGASSEIGMKLLERIYHNYSCIYLQYRQMNEGLSALIDRVGKNVNVIPIQADFSKEADVRRMIEIVKRKGDMPNHIVHLPAPKAYNKQFHKDNWANYEEGWEVSFRSIVMILQAFIPGMARQRYGRVIFMLTSCTLNFPAKFQASYVSVKYALLGLMKSLSVEYIGKGITVNGVSPDMMETKFLSDLPKMLVESNAYNSPLGRNICPEEVIPLFDLLLADSSGAITGQNIGISGGL